MEGIGTDWAMIRRLKDIIGKHSLLDPEAADKLAKGIFEDLDLRTETSDILGADYLGGVQISRWSTGWFKR